MKTTTATTPQRNCSMYLTRSARQAHLLISNFIHKMKLSSFSDSLHTNNISSLCFELGDYGLQPINIQFLKILDYIRQI